MFGLRISWVSYVEKLVFPLLKFWKCDLSFLENEPSNDPVYSVNSKSGCYTFIVVDIPIVFLIHLLIHSPPNFFIT